MITCSRWFSIPIRYNQESNKRSQAKTFMGRGTCEPGVFLEVNFTIIVRGQKMSQEKTRLSPRRIAWVAVAEDPASRASNQWVVGGG